MKRIVQIGVTGLVSLSLTAAMTPAWAMAQTQDCSNVELTPEVIAQIKADERAFGEFEEVIDAVEEELVLNEDGQLEIEDKRALKSEIGAASYREVMQCLAVTNEMEESGEVDISENGTVFDPTDGSLVIQGKAVNKTEWKWWGVRNCYKQKRARDVAYRYAMCGAGLTGASALATAVNLPLGLAVGLSAARCDAIAASINYYNTTKRGVILKLLYAGPFTCQKQ